MSAGARRIWWATWPGALALGLLSLMMVAVTAVPLVSVALQAAGDVSGTDVTATSGPGGALRVTWAVLGVACLSLPVAVVVLARRRWLGWVLATLTASLVVLGAGLAALGFL